MSGQRKKSTQPTGRAKPHDPQPGPVVKSEQAQATSKQKLRSESIRGSREVEEPRFVAWYIGRASSRMGHRPGGLLEG